MVILVRVWCGWSLIGFRSSVLGIGFRSSVLGRVKDQFASLNIKLCLESSGNVFIAPPPPGLEILVKILRFMLKHKG